MGAYSIWECMECGLWRTIPIPSNEELYRLYNEKYYKGDYRNLGYIDYKRDREILRKNFELRINAAVDSNSEGNWLDIGCALGFLLEIVKEKGFNAYGLDINRYAVKYCKSNGLNNVICGDSTIEAFGPKKFDYISLFDILEHTLNPAFLLKEAIENLKLGGFLLLDLFDPCSLISRLCGKYWHVIEPPDHLHYFPVNTIVNFLKLKGLSYVSHWRLAKFIKGDAILVKLNIYDIVSKSKLLKKEISKITIRVNLFDNYLLLFQKC